jgi:alkaline phosphatase
MTRLLGSIGTVIVLLAATGPLGAQVADNNHEVKYVIFMVPDGMGALANVTAARIRLNGIAGNPLYLETLDHIGYMRTFSEKNTVTDSSAAASAWACGEKFVNNEVCLHASGAPYNPSLLELAQRAGMSTGLVATQTITHATPAAFAAHTAVRNCETEIARQYVEVTRPDVMLGGGVGKFRTSTPDRCGVAGDYIAEAVSTGYTYVQSEAEMDLAVAAGKARLLGLFANSNMTPEYLRTPNTTEPRLPDTTRAALALLENNTTGFFLMVEGSLIDSGNHAENGDYQFGEIRAFDEAVKVVLDWMAAKPNRRQHTLLIIAPDHETGAFAVKGTETPGAPSEPLGTFFYYWGFALDPSSPKDFEAHHTGADVPIWSSGPGSEALGKAIDNTIVYNVVKSALKF